MLKTVGNPSTRYGDQTIVDGNLVVGTTGKGVDFSANSGTPGATSELLDWYEEGVIAVEVSGSVSGSGTLPSSNASLSYTRIGNIVTATFIMQSVTFPTYSGSLQFTLPYTASKTCYGSMVYYYDTANWSTGASFAGWQALVSGGSDKVIFQIAQVNGNRQIFANDANTVTSNTGDLFLSFTITYIA